MRRPCLFAAVLALWAPGALAALVEIVSVRAVQAWEDKWQFDVELRHPDEGWDHYADRWEVLGPGGELLGTRVLLHPHVEEQPFTRSLRDLSVPAAVTAVTIRARCSVDGYEGGQNVTLELER